MSDQPAPPDLVAALADLFERYSDARTDYGPAPTEADIASSEAAAARALGLMQEHAEARRSAACDIRVGPPTETLTVPSEARPWDLTRALLPDAKLLLWCEQKEGAVLVHGFDLCEGKRSCYVSLSPPVFATGDSLDVHPEWLARIVSARRPASLIAS